MSSSSPSQMAQRRLVQDRLGRRGQPTSLRQQPGLEGRGVLDVEPVEEVGTEPGQGDGLPPVTVHQDVDVDGGPDGQREPYRIAVQRRTRSEPPPDLGQAPPECSQRVVGLGEQQRGEPAPCRWALCQQQEREDGPALATAVAVAVGTVDLEAGSAEQLDGQPGRPRPCRDAVDRHDFSLLHGCSEVVRAPPTRRWRPTSSSVAQNRSLGHGQPIIRRARGRCRGSGRAAPTGRRRRGRPRRPRAPGRRRAGARSPPPSSRPAPRLLRGSSGARRPP